LALAQRPNQTIARDQLMDWVWKDTFPTPDVLTQAIKELRKAFEDDQKSPRFIETIPKIGYRWIAEAQFAFIDRSLTKIPEPVPQASTNVGQAIIQVLPNLSAQMNSTVVEQMPGRIKNTSYRRFGVALGLGLILLSTLILYRHAKQEVVTPEAALKSSLRVLTSDLGIERNPVISNNGRILSYTRLTSDNRARIWVRDLATANSTALNPLVDSQADTDIDELQPQLSQDGLELTYARFQGASHQSPTSGVPYEGGGECHFVTQRILAGIAKNRAPCPLGMVLPFSWAASNEILVSIQNTSPTNTAQQSVGIYAINLEDGTRRRLGSTPEQSVFDLFPKRSPDGRFLAFRRGGNVDSVLMLADADGSKPKPLVRLGFSARGMDWLPDSSALIASISDDSDHELVKIDRSGKLEHLHVAGQFPSIAGDGQIVMNLIDEETGLFDYALDQSDAGTRIVASTRADGIPAISPDGKLLVFQSQRSGIYQLWMASTKGLNKAWQARPITQKPGRFSNMHWEADSAGFWYAQYESESAQSSVYRFDVATEKSTPFPITQDLGLILRVSKHQEQLYLLASLEGRRSLWWLDLDPDAAHSNLPVRVMDDVGSFQIDPQSSRFFLTRIGNNTLFELLEDRTLNTIIAPFEPQFIWHWRVQDQQIYFHQNQPAGMALVAFDVRTTKQKTIRALPSGDMALDWAQRRVIVPQPVRVEMDIATLSWPGSTSQ
jgi:Tol biopolymer transport system component